MKRYERKNWTLETMDFNKLQNDNIKIYSHDFPLCSSKKKKKKTAAMSTR